MRESMSGGFAPVQLSLGVSLRDDATFTNFYAADDNNRQILAAVEAASRGEGETNLVIWGSRGAGLTHLLQACSHAACERGITVQYLPLRELIGYAPRDICEGLEAMELVCLDGVDEICGNREWEQALFHLFNNLRDAGHRLLMASHTSPPSIPMLLPDLKSRVLGSVVYRLHGLTDDDKQIALQMRAKARGMEMPDEVARYILSRAPRDTNELFLMLNVLDDESLQQQRKLTIPFVKDVLGF
jgi:DnaA family protein